MDVVAHWIAYDPTSVNGLHTPIRDEAELADYGAHGYTIEGPFVHADALRGAVEALRRIVWAENRGPDGTAESAYMVQVARDALDAASGGR